MEALIEAELSELRRTVEKAVEFAKLQTCVRSSVRVQITPSEYKSFTICLTFPVCYPRENHILIEIKSKHLATKLLDGLIRVAEKEAKNLIGKPHCLHIIKFIAAFFESNPLSVCSEEIARCKAKVDESGGDVIKLSQKTSSISVTLVQKRYRFKFRLTVPHEYPEKQVELDPVDCNFPRVFQAWFTEQGREIGRRCVQPPLRPRPKDPPFRKKPSLGPVLAFLIENVKRYPEEICQVCQKVAFPADPASAVHNEHAAAHVERVYCSHIFHHDCLILYMKTPPFEGGKKCPACKQRIYHEKWKVTPELAEARWAHEQAKNRELGEVVDFFGDLAVTS